MGFSCNKYQIVYKCKKYLGNFCEPLAFYYAGQKINTEELKIELRLIEIL